MSVGTRFDGLLRNLALTPDQRTDGIKKHGGVRACLNSNYWGSSSESANSFLVGSWGKSTEVRPPRDIDVLFELPDDAYYRFEKRPGNKQSQLLQEVRDVLSRTYSTSKIKGDGPVVIVAFTSYAVEVVPAFALESGGYFVCDTKNGGCYKKYHPKAEIEHVKSSNDRRKGNTRDLIRLMKCWQGYCSVDIKSFVLELIAVEFLDSWPHAGNSSVYYDWMVRDFFAFLVKKATSIVSWVLVPGTGEFLWLNGSAWKSKAESAHGRAVKACVLEAARKPKDAWNEWVKIFGFEVPLQETASVI